MITWEQNFIYIHAEQSLNHVSVNVAYSMSVQHLLTSTTHLYWVLCLAKAKWDPVAQYF
jgi:hypothetical protein